MGYLYKFTFPNGQQYVGLTTKEMNRRLSLHRYHAKSGRPGALQAAIRKFGPDSFVVEILAQEADLERLKQMEIEAIAVFGTRAPKGYNLTSGGEGAPGWSPTVEQRQRASERMKAFMVTADRSRFGRPPGWKHSEEAKEKIANAGRGRVFSQECRDKIARSKLGNTYATGKPRPEDVKRRISETQKGRPRHDAAARARISAQFKGKPWSAIRRANHEAKKAAREKARENSLA